MNIIKDHSRGLKNRIIRERRYSNLKEALLYLIMITVIAVSLPSTVYAWHSVTGIPPTRPYVTEIVEENINNLVGCSFSTMKYTADLLSIKSVTLEDVEDLVEDNLIDSNYINGTIDNLMYIDNFSKDGFNGKLNTFYYASVDSISQDTILEYVNKHTKVEDIISNPMYMGRVVDRNLEGISDEFSVNYMYIGETDRLIILSYIIVNEDALFAKTEGSNNPMLKYFNKKYIFYSYKDYEELSTEMLENKEIESKRDIIKTVDESKINGANMYVLLNWPRSSENIHHISTEDFY